MPAEGLRQLHFAAAFMHQKDTRSANGAGKTPSDILTFQVSAPRWLSALHLRCRGLLELGHCRLASAAADELSSTASRACCYRNQGAAAATLGAAAAMDHNISAAAQSYAAAQSALAQASDAGAASADVLVALGDTHVCTGARAQARNVWELAADVLMHATHAQGMHEEQNAPELVNIYAADREALVRALLKAAWGAAICNDLRAALGRLKEASAVLTVCRAGPAVHSQVDLMHGQLHWRLFGAAIQEERSLAFSMLSQAATVACAETPCMYTVARDALLQSAMLALHALHGGISCIEPVAAKPADTIEAVLSKARDLACMRMLLETCSTDVGLPELSSLPQWFLVRLKAADAHHKIESRRTKPAADESELKQASLRALCALCTMSPGAGLTHTASCEQQSTAVHACLKAALPKYAEKCCVRDVSEVSNLIRNLDDITAAAQRNTSSKKAEGDHVPPEATAQSAATAMKNSVHVQWVVDEIPCETATPPGTTQDGAAMSAHKIGKKRAGMNSGKKTSGSFVRGARGVSVATSEDSCRTWMLITVRTASGTEVAGGGKKQTSSVLAGAAVVESNRLHSVMQQVRMMKVRLAAHKDGSAGMVLQGIFSDDSQARCIHVFHLLPAHAHTATLLFQFVCNNLVQDVTGLELYCSDLSSSVLLCSERIQSIQELRCILTVDHS
jgi:hypothetical protein